MSSPLLFAAAFFQSSARALKASEGQRFSAAIIVACFSAAPLVFLDKAALILATIIAVGCALGMLLFCGWSFAWDEIYFRRYCTSKCVFCGYQLEPKQPKVCPECGEPPIWISNDS